MASKLLLAILINIDALLISTAPQKYDQFTITKKKVEEKSLKLRKKLKLKLKKKLLRKKLKNQLKRKKKNLKKKLKRLKRKNDTIQKTCTEKENG